MKKIVHTARAPKTLGPYSQAVVDHRSGLLFTAGQIGIDPQTGELAGAEVGPQTQQALSNLRAVLESGGCGFDHVLKTTIFLKNMSDFAEVNTIYAEIFSREFPARSTVEVSKLPKDALVEIEMIARVPE